MQQPNFSPLEIEVAIEVIDEALKPGGDYVLLVAVLAQNQPVGYICFGLIPLTVGRYDLYWVAVDPASGRQGIGSLLLQAMEESIRRQGAAHVYVDTSSTTGYTPARAFYEKHGYQVACVMADFYRTGDNKVVFRKEIQ
jgi:ribosomal protein S18 acetylase RimI-like enzyme